MNHTTIDTKKLYEVNQFLKKNPYYYDMVDHQFISHDGQSDMIVSSAELKIENPGSALRYLVIDDGGLLYHFLTLAKKLIDKGDGSKKAAAPCVLTKVGFECNGQLLRVRFSDKLDLPMISCEPKATLKTLDGKKASLYYEKDMIKDGDIVMNDIIEIIVAKTTFVDNKFLFLELIGSEIHLYESKLALSLDHKTLICLNNFAPLKAKKGTTGEYMTLHIGKSKLFVSYGNSQYDFVYKFHLHDLHG